MGENEQINQGLQDVAEKLRAKVKPPLPKRPYKFLDYFEAADQSIFFGRDEEADILQNQIIAHKLTILFGQSGVGKTSLINAGVIPRLEEEGYTSLYPRVLREPAASIKSSLSQAALQLGQDAILPCNLITQQEDLCSFLERTLPSESHLVIFLKLYQNLVDSGKWVESSGRSGLFTLESYKELGGAEGILASYLNDALAERGCFYSSPR